MCYGYMGRLIFKHAYKVHLWSNRDKGLLYLNLDKSCYTHTENAWKKVRVLWHVKQSGHIRINALICILKKLLIFYLKLKLFIFYLKILQNV